MAGQRDRYLDLVRGTSILAVVVGHWLVADLWWGGDQLQEVSALGQVPSMWPLTWVFQVIPLFFLVAGSVNGRSWRSARLRGQGYATFVDRRVHRVLAPTAVYLAVVLPLAVVADAGGGWGVRAGGAMLLQPLWFLAVYLVVVALTPVTVRWHERWGWAVPVAMLGAAVAADVVRIGGGVPMAGYLNVLTVWLLVYQLGYFEAQARITRPVATALAVAGLTMTSVLVWLGPYPARMVGVAGDRIANMHPPTLALTGLALAQVGIMVLLRPWVQPWLSRDRVWRGVVWLNLSIMTLYLWHQVALIGTARVVLALGWPHPAAGSAGWWLAHLGLVAVAGAVLVALVAVFGRFERVAVPAPVPSGAVTAVAAVVVTVLVSLGLLALAGTRVTEPWVAVDVLAGLHAGPMVGVAALLAGAWAARANRRGRTVGGLVAAAVVLLAAAAAYRAGLGPLAGSSEVAALLTVLAGGVLAVAVWAAAVRTAADSGRRAAAARPLARSRRAGGR